AQAARTTADAGKALVFADFRKASFADWFLTGEAFGAAPSKGAEQILQLDGTPPIRRLVPPGVAHSGLISGKLQGALRSPTFTIGKKKIHYLVAGSAGKLNLILDGLQLIREP